VAHGENPRGVHAVEILHDIHGVTLDSLTRTALSIRHLTAFEVLLPPLLEAYDHLASDDPRKAALKEPVALLRAWDRRTGEDSVATAVAIFWGEAMIRRNPDAALKFDEPVFSFLIDHMTDNERLDSLTEALGRLQQDFGQWNTPWGAINRYQRLNDDIAPHFDDDKPSLAVGLTSSQWGSLAAFEPQKPRVNRKLYGVSGNSFLAAIEFGPTVHAKVLILRRRERGSGLGAFHRPGRDVPPWPVPRCAADA
jgi:acyl-homoserine-lactone acylase